MGQSFFSSSVVESGNMKPFAALTFVMGCAFGAPADLALNGVGYAGLGVAGVHDLGYAAAPAAVGVAAAAPAVTVAAAPAVAAAPVAYGAEHYSAGPVVPYAPPAALHLTPLLLREPESPPFTSPHQLSPSRFTMDRPAMFLDMPPRSISQLPPIFPLLSQLSSREPRLSTPLLSRPRLRSTMSRPQSMSRSLMMLLMTLLS